MNIARDDGWREVLPQTGPRIRRFAKHLMCGFRARFPVCCVFRFALEAATRNVCAQAAERGIMSAGRSRCVPCLIIHRADRRSSWEVRRRDWHMLVRYHEEGS